MNICFPQGPPAPFVEGECRRPVILRNGIQEAIDKAQRPGQDDFVMLIGGQFDFGLGVNAEYKRGSTA